MVDAARSIECVAMREQFRVTDVIIEDGAIAGIRGEDSIRLAHIFRAPLVIGADGLRSTFAKLGSEKIGAFERKDVECARAYYYAYFEGVPRAKLDDVLITEFETSPGTASLACRCNDDLVVAAVAFDAREMRDFRTDLDGEFPGYIGESSTLGEHPRGCAYGGENSFLGPVAQHLARSGLRRRNPARRCGTACRSSFRPGTFVRAH